MVAEDVDPKEILKTKRVTTRQELCFALPDCLIDFVKYVQSLEFTEKPDYTYCRELFDRQLKEKRFDADYW